MSDNKVLLLLYSLILFSSCNNFSTVDPKDTSDKKTEAKVTQSLPNNPREVSSLKYTSEGLQIEDVEIEVKIPSVSRIEKKILPAEMLENKDDKPGKLHPRCVAINFEGDYAKGNSENESWFPARLMICPVNEYPKVLEKSDFLVKDFQKRISNLNEILLLKPEKIDKQFAIIDYIDAEPEFFVNLNYVSFKSGDGFFVITQFANEPTVINNNELIGVFQGFTSDKKYYVLGTFPVKSTHLPDDFESKNLMKDKDEYDEYIIEVKKILKDESSFTPKLEQILDTVKSIEIKQSTKR